MHSIHAHWTRRCLVAAILLGCLLLSLNAAAAEKRAGVGALKSIPADAAFYVSCLRNREQVEAVAHSRAWAKLQALPAVQMARGAIQAQLASPNPQLQAFLQMYQMPE